MNWLVVVGLEVVAEGKGKDLREELLPSSLICATTSIGEGAAYEAG